MGNRLLLGIHFVIRTETPHVFSITIRASHIHSRIADVRHLDRVTIARGDRGGIGSIKKVVSKR